MSHKSIANRSAQSIDTSPDIEKIQISLIRKLSIAERISILRSLSQTVIQLSRRAIARANSEFSEEELKGMFVEYHYGDELANRFRSYLGVKHREKA